MRDTQHDEGLWELLPELESTDADDLFGILEGGGSDEPRVAAMIILGSCFLTLEDPVDSPWRTRLVMALTAIQSGGTESSGIRAMASSNLANATAQEIVQRKKQSDG